MARAIISRSDNSLKLFMPSYPLNFTKFLQHNLRAIRPKTVGPLLWLPSGEGLQKPSVTDHELWLKRIEGGTDAVGVLGIDLSEERELPLDDVFGYSLHCIGIVGEEPLLLPR